MTAQTEVSKEVSVIEEKSGLDMSSYHDLTMPHHNGINHTDQANDPDHSYVFVTGADGSIDDPRADVVTAKGSSVEPKADSFEVHNGKLDVVNGDVSKSLKEGEIENVKGSDAVPPLVTVNVVPSEIEKFPEGKDVVQSAVAHTPGLQNQPHAEALIKHVEDSNGSCESLVEIEKVADQNENIQGGEKAETKKVEDSNPGVGSGVGPVLQKVADQNENLKGAVETESRQVEDSSGRHESSAVPAAEKVVDRKGEIEVAKIEIKQVKDSDAALESSAAAAMERVSEQNGKITDVVENEIMKVEDSNGRLESSAGGAMENVADHNEKIKAVVETVIKEVGDSNGRLESLAGCAMENMADHSEKVKAVVETVIKEVEDSKGRLESLVGGVMENMKDQKGTTKDVVEIEIKKVEDSNGRLESSAEGAMENVANQNEKIQAVVETEIREVEDLQERLDISAGVIMENVADQNGTIKDVVETEIKQVEDSNGRHEISVETAMENAGDRNENIQAVVDTEITEVEELQGRLDSSAGVMMENVAYQNGTIKDVVETESKQVEDSNGRLESSAGAEIEKVVDQNKKIIDVVESEIKHVEDTTERLEISAGDATTKVVDQIERNPCARETEIKQVKDSNRRLESSAGAPVKKLVAQNEKMKGVVEFETKQVEHSNGRLESSGEAAMEKVADQNVIVNGVVETEIRQVDDFNGRLESSVEAANEKIADQNGKSSAVGTEIKQGEDLKEVLESAVAAVEKVAGQNGKTEVAVKPAENQDGRHESSAGAEMKKAVDQNGKIEHMAETEIKQVEDSNGRLESSVGAVMEKVVDQNEIVEGAEEIKLEKIKDQNQSESSPSVENQEPQAGAFRPVAETKENDEINDLPSCSDEVGHSKDSHEDQSNLDSSETSGECQGSQKVIAEAVECDMSTEGQNEIKLTQEVVESAEHEVHLAASMDSDLESCSINNKETTDEKAETASGSDVKESRECDTAPIFNVQEGLEQVDETKTMVIIDDCNVKTVSDQGLVVKNKEDFAVSHVEDRVQYSEETEKQSNDHGVSPEIVQSETETEATVPTKKAADVKDIGDQLYNATVSTDDNLLLKENEDNGKSKSDSIAMASSEGSSTDAIPGKSMHSSAVTKPFNYLTRIPRFNDEILQEQIRLAKLAVDEKTKLRDAIQKQIQEKRVNNQIYGVDYEYAKGEDRSARKLVRSKRMEIDALQSVINKAKNAMSIEDIDSRINKMEHMIQHETLPLKEEKQFIREIKQLKQLREQLSSNMGSQDEIKQALEQREEVEDRIKNLRKELDILKEKVIKTESAAAGAERKYDDEYKKVRELQAQFRAADDVRQEAYVRWQSLRKELSEKNKHFFKFKNDAAAANNYAFGRDREGFYRHCINQVENFMELWNTNEEFRKEYTRFNARSTIRRLGTFDGRSLGPDEERPILPSYVDERVDRIVSVPAKVDSISQSPPELKQETIEENGTTDDKAKKKVTEHKNQAVKTKVAGKTASGNGLATVSGRDTPDEVQGEPVKSREEIELERKAEEKRKIEAEIKLKEQHRLEELAKANEARERKKRHVEKLQMRAELKAQKEAEQKEKEREKRLRKKERKNIATTEVSDSNNNCDSAPSSESAVETSKEIEAKAPSSATTKKPKKAPSTLTKQSKMKSVPPPLRNRNRKKWQQYAWVGATSLLIFILFWLGNLGVFSNLNLRGGN